MTPMMPTAEEDFELELRGLPGVLNVALGRDDGGEVGVVTLAVYGPDNVETMEVARQIANLYFPDVEIVIEDVNQEVRPEQVATRVQLVGALFNATSGLCEVELSHEGRTGRGSTVSGPLIGGAAATLAALADLGYQVPFTLLSVTGVSIVKDWPVIVALRPLGEGSDRYGVAQSPEDVVAAARATLDALNRYTLSLE